MAEMGSLLQTQEVAAVTGEEAPSLRHNKLPYCQVLYCIVLYCTVLYSLRHKLPYCQAVIMEVQRLACVAPQTIPHR